MLSFSRTCSFRAEHCIQLPGFELATLQIEGVDADGPDPREVARQGFEVEVAEKESGKLF